MQEIGGRKDRAAVEGEVGAQSQKWVTGSVDHSGSFSAALGNDADIYNLLTYYTSHVG